MTIERKQMNQNNLSHYESLYYNEIRSKLKEQLGLKNIHEVPFFNKVVLNMGVGDSITDNKVLDKVQNELSLIAGQRAVKTVAKKSVATFKLRKGMQIGLKVTLRGRRMMEFLERLVNIALPRIRDFRGLSSRSFDMMGNYNFGIKEHIIFPEIDYDTITKIRGMDISININSKSKEHSLMLLKSVNFPISER